MALHAVIRSGSYHPDKRPDSYNLYLQREASFSKSKDEKKEDEDEEHTEGDMKLISHCKSGSRPIEPYNSRSSRIPEGHAVLPCQILRSVIKDDDTAQKLYDHVCGPCK